MTDNEPKALAAAREILIGILSAIAFIVTTEFVPGGLFVIVGGGLLVLVLALIRGNNLPLWLRTFITAFIFLWAAETSLVGRTMAPGLTAYTAKMAFLYFALIGWWPAVALIRIWQPRTAIKLLCALFPAALALAAIVAGMEEYLFIQKHRANGIGPTARWTVSNHWLAYDHHRQQLTGSD